MARFSVIRPPGVLGDSASLVALAVATVAAAAAELLVTLRPEQIQLPPQLDGALRPVWAHPAAVVMALVCFGVAAVAFIAAPRVEASTPDYSRSLRVQRNPAGPLARTTRAILGGGLLIWAWVVVRLASAPTDSSLPGLFVLALLALLGSLALHEWRWLRPRRWGWHVSRASGLEAASVLVLLGVFTCLMTFDLNNWYYSSIGDEHAFYLLAAQLARGAGERSLFSQHGAYGLIPVLSSYVEAAQMHIFGLTGSGWKVATVTPVIVALVVTYGLARLLFNRQVALLSLAFLSTSHYLLAYGHTGYPNLEPLLPGVLAPLLFVLGTRRSSIVLLVAAGLIAGLGWYTYYTSRATIVILAAATLLVVRPGGWAATAAPLVVGFGVMVMPLFAVSRLDVIATMLDQTGGGTATEAAANRALLPLWNTGRSLLAFNYNTHAGPWLSGSLLEPLAGAFFIVGLVWLLTRWRDVRIRLLLVWFAIAMVISGVVSKYDYVSVSRLVFLLPLVCLVGGIAAGRVVAILEQRVPRRLCRLVFPTVVVSCAVLAGWGNLQRWFVDTPASVPTTPTSVAIRIIEDPRCQTAPRPPLVVDVGIGGSILPAIEAAGPRVMPEFGLYGDTPA